VVDGMAKRSFLGAAASWDRVVQQTLVPASAAKHVRGTAAHDAGVADDATGCASGDVQVRALAGRRDLPSLCCAGLQGKREALAPNVRKRFVKRIDRPEKNWKFSASDIADRTRWDELPADILGHPHPHEH
jgi:hypothetical protein